MNPPGVVYLVGAGPGDPGLLTRRGAELLARAEVVVHDGLVHAALLELAAAGCERIYAGKKHAVAGSPLTQEEIARVLVDRARSGRRVVRLKGGDPFVFGRGAEECRALAAAGIRFEVVPGVTSGTAAAAYAGIPLTARGVSATVAFATGHEEAGKPESDVDWVALARAGTVVLFMAVRTARECAARLVAAGRAPETPAAVIHWGTTAAQRTLVTTLAELGAAVEDAGIRPPALLVIGEVVRLRDEIAWYERRPLFGARVVLTRPRAEAGPAARALAELGAEAVTLPVTRIEPAVDRAPIAAAAATLAAGGYRWVIFASANAVRHTFEELGARGLDARVFGGARVACVGRATARALAERGLRADLVPAHGDARALAEAVRAAQESEEIGGDPAMRALWPRAAGGRDEGIEALRAAGVEVDAVTVYRTVSADPADPELAYGLERLRAREVRACAFFAPSQVRALFELLGAEAAGLIAACEVVAAIGPTTARALRDRGVAVQVVPGAPDAEALASEIAFRAREEKD